MPLLPHILLRLLERFEDDAIRNPDGISSGIEGVLDFGEVDTTGLDKVGEDIGVVKIVEFSGGVGEDK